MKRFVLFVLLMLMPWEVWGATVYVSNAATNGYAVGNYANNYAQAQNKGTPWLTLTKAVSNAITEGDTIVMNDGTYPEVNQVITGRDNLTITNDSSIGTSYGVIVNCATGLTRVLLLAKVNTGIGYSIGPIVFDAQSTQAYCVTTDSGAKVTSVTFTGTKFLNPTTAWFTTNKVATLTMTGNWIAESSGAAVGVDGGMIFMPDVTAGAGAYSISDGTLTMTGAAGAPTRGIYGLASVAGQSLTVSNVNISITATNTTHGMNLKGFQVGNINSNTINILTATNATPISVFHDAALNYTSWDIWGNTGVMNAATDGYFVQVGSDIDVDPGTSVGTVKIYQNTFTKGNHGYFLGWVTSGRVYQNKGTNMVIGVIGKHTTSCTFDNNLLIGGALTGGALRAKASTNDGFYNNTVVMNTNGAYGQVATDSSTGIVFKNNLISAPSNTIGYFTIVNALSDATQDYNLYYTGVALPANAWNYQATDYATFVLWQAAGHDANSINSDPLFFNVTNSDYRLQRTSPCRNAGTDVSLTSDFRGRQVPMNAVPDIGAYESKSSHLFGKQKGPVRVGKTYWP